MATRDRSQGYGFVYVDVPKLLSQLDQIIANPEKHPQEDTVMSVHIKKEDKV